MVVRKYRRVEDMPGPPSSSPGLEGLAAACATTESCQAIGVTSQAPRGVRRFRSVEEADAHRQSWELPDREPGPTATAPPD